MSEPVSTMPRLHDPACALGGSAQGGTGAGGDGADPLLDQAPPRCDGIEVGRVGRQKADGGAGLFDQRPAPARLVGRQVVEDDDIARAQPGDQAAGRTQVTKRAVFMAPQKVLRVSQRSRRIAPTSVKLSPQLRGLGSTSTIPRGNQACDRPIARLAPDSSSKTRRRGSIWRTHDLVRPAATVFF